MTATETAYNLTLDYLYSFVDYSLKHASELAKADFNLDRMRALMQALGDPQDAYPTIHIAGTKGKGSTSALCAAALQAAGYKTGLYTSPHLQDYCERIQMNGQPIAHADLSALVEKMKPAVASVPYLTTFEITTALGFLYFAAQGADVAVIEVGLGGRLDATNIITPRVAVITSLSYDHMAVLGNSLAQIAGEKAGIIKPGVPVVSSQQKNEALEVLTRVAHERNAPLTLVGREFTYQTINHSLDGQTFTVRGPSSTVDFSIPLLGSHQVENAATAYAALQASGFNLSDADIQKGFASVQWPCRFEIISRAPLIVLDSAHNEDSFQKLAQTLEDYLPGRQATLILGISEDKHLAEMLAAIKPKLARLIVTRADHPRALGPEQLIETARQLGVESESAIPVSAALARALELSARDGNIVLSAGSMFVTAEVKTAWQKMAASR